MINRVSLLSPLPVNQSLYEGVNTSAGLVMVYYNKHKLRNHLHWFNAKQTLIPANHSHHWLQLQRNSNERLIALARQGIKDKFVTMSCLLNCEEFDSFEFWISWVCMQLSSFFIPFSDQEWKTVNPDSDSKCNHPSWRKKMILDICRLLNCSNCLLCFLWICTMIWFYSSLPKGKKNTFDMCDFWNSVF